MAENKNLIACPSCTHEFEVQEVLAKIEHERLRREFKAHFDKVKAEEAALQQKKDELENTISTRLSAEKQKLQAAIKHTLQQEYSTELAALKADNEQKQKLVEQAKAQQLELERKQNELRIKEQDLLLNLEKEKAEYQQQQERTYKERLQNELKDREAEIIRKTSEENQQRLAAQAEDLERQQQQIRELKQKELEFERQKRQHDDEKRDLEIKFEQQRSEIRKELEDKISKRYSEDNEMKLREKDEIIRQMREQVEEAKRRAEQGSMQLQGEVQELALEEMLRAMFPMDDIGEVGKGVRGADVVHTVRNNQYQECGKILYESKRTKHFSAEWIAKLKADMAFVKADICVIVTEALPEGIDKIGIREDVWICTFQDVKGLTLALRESLIACHHITAGQTNKGEKMQMLYDFLTGTEFKQQIMAIIEGFGSLQEQLLKERRVMEAQWASREKQLQKVLMNTQRFYGSIRGIAGNAVPAIAALEPESLLEEATLDQDSLTDENTLPVN